MLSPRQVAKARSFYQFSIENRIICCDGSIASSTSRESGVTWYRFYSVTGRPSIDPELIIRMLIVGYWLCIRSERRPCDEVHFNLSYWWFCRLSSRQDFAARSIAPSADFFNGISAELPSWVEKNAAARTDGR